MSLSRFGFCLKKNVFQSSLKSINTRACVLRRSLSTYYTSSHEYVKVEGETGTVGITDFAQNMLGDVVYVDLPSVGDKFEKGECFGSVESVKAANDVYLPVSGEITDVNSSLDQSPDLINQAAMTDAWFVKIKIDKADEVNDLLDEEAYQSICEEE